MINELKDIIEVGISRYNGCKMLSEHAIGLGDIENVVLIDDSKWHIKIDIKKLINDKKEYKVKVTFGLVEGTFKNSNVFLKINLKKWNDQNYVFMPGATYNGNRFRILAKKYPPKLQVEDGIGIDIPIVMNDNPHLKKEGNHSKIHLLSGDLASPIVGVQYSDKKEGLLITTEHKSTIGYTGLLIEESDDRQTAFIKIETPGVREKVYRDNKTDIESDDIGYDFKVGDKVTINANLYIFSSNDITTFYDQYFEIRNDFSSYTKIQELPFFAAYDLIEDKYNKGQFNEEHGYYKTSVKKHMYCDWQAGWCGGGINSYALMVDGNTLSNKRADETMDSIFSTLQHKNGYIYGIMYKGEKLGDDFKNTKNYNILLLRRNADVLVFASKYIILKKKRNEYINPIWLLGIKKLSDALVRLFDKYGLFGQFIDLEKEEILIGSTASAGIVVGGLVLSYRILDNIRYMEVAKKAANYYYNNFVLKGITNGGPGEIMQGPDSESAFGLLYSFVTLYDETREDIFLKYAINTAKQCASWCMTYDFDFPKTSEFYRLNMRTLGSVFANVQNKHSAPGICTLSGVSLFRLYRATLDERFINLLRDIAHNMTQYLSREDQVINTWDNETLESGWMCERVNTSDWEGKNKIGEVFKGDCWCEVSTLLTYAEIPGIYFQLDTGYVCVFDHVDVSIKEDQNDWLLAISNPTKFDAKVKIYTEKSTALLLALKECFMEDAIVVNIKSMGNKSIRISKEG